MEAILRTYACGDMIAREITQATLAAIEAQGWMVVQGWQPIESAPKDGTAIIVTRPTIFESEDGWHVVRWDDGWWQVHCGKFDNPLRGDDPTHWMPLPASPPHPWPHKA